MSLMFTPFMGVVEDIHDPEDGGLGRVRVRVFGEHTDNKGMLPTNMLKWFTVLLNNSSGVSGIGDSPTGYVEGSLVFGYFVDEEHQEGFVIGALPGRPGAPGNPQKGFNDPTGTYPVYINESDVNRLARGVETALVAQKRNVVSGIPGAFPGDTISEPQTAFAAKYPYNRVFETPSGHVIEYDDTPGAERIAIHHKSGSFDEFHPDGQKVSKTHGDLTEITLGDRTVYVNSTYNVAIAGDAYTNVGGIWRVKASKAIFDCDVDIYGDSNANDHISSKVSGKDHVHTGVEKGNSKSEGPYGKQEGVFTPTPANSFGFSDDDTEWTESKVQEGVEKGYFTYQEYNEQAVEDPTTKEEEETPVEKTEPEITPCGISVVDGRVDYNTQLSDNYKLSDLTINAAVSQYRIVPQNGLSEQEIACNLKNVAENVLERIKAQYPSVLVTSAFRRGSGRSQHLVGQAVDMQFPGMSKRDYFAVAQWIKTNVPYDQLLLEWKSTGSRMPWIHVSLKREESANRYQILTLWNHRTYSSGLVDLSGG